MGRSNPSSGKSRATRGEDRGEFRGPITHATVTFPASSSRGRSRAVRLPRRTPATARPNLGLSLRRTRPSRPRPQPARAVCRDGRGSLPVPRHRRRHQCVPTPLAHCSKLFGVKASIHPDYTLANVHCSCGNQFYTRSTERRSARRALLRVPPVLHRQTEAGRHRRSRRALPASDRPKVEPVGGRTREPDRGLRTTGGLIPTPPRAVNGGDPLRMPDGALVAKRDAPVGGQAVLEGVMMRGVSTWAVAVRTPEGQIEVESESLRPWAKRHRDLAGPGPAWRRRPRRINGDRLPCPGDLGQRPDRGRRGRRAGGDRRLGLGPDDRLLADPRGRPFLRRPGRADQPDQGQARLGRSSSGWSRAYSAPASSSATSGAIFRKCRTCGGPSSTTAPSTRRSPVTRPKTS